MSDASLSRLLQLTSPPIAITFVDAPPPGVDRVAGSEPAGCGYWRRAAQGEVFYTVADDHKACPVGAHTHHVRGNARQLMLLSEAAQLAGVAGASAPLGRPTCAVLPAAINSQLAAASFGCIGNRVYTGAAEDEAYFAFPGSQLDAIVVSLQTVVRANDTLREFHRARVGCGRRDLSA
jgi:uncharacterized protein (DUF169 family)